MADCCTPGTGFPSSTMMDQLALNQSVVWEEICKLQQAILAAASQCQSGGGQFCTTVAGNTPMTFVAGISGVTVTNGGSGYYNDNPTVKFIPPYGSSSTGATGTVTTNGGKILSVNVTAGGSGYQPLSSTLTISSGTGSVAQLQPLVNAAGQIISVAILNAGHGYTTSDTVVAHRAVAPNVAYVGATFKITTVGASGEILAVAVLTTGSGYQDSVTTVQIVSSLNSALPYPLGAGFVGTVMVDISGTILSVLVNNGGVGYTTYPPYLVISNPGYGAITQVNLTGTSVTSITVVESGSNYVATPTGVVYNPTTAGTPNPPSNFAQVSIQFTANIYGTTPNSYYQVFVGSMTNKQLAMQMNTVISYFTNLGYTITRNVNSATGTTMQWTICW